MKFFKFFKRRFPMTRKTDSTCQDKPREDPSLIGHRSQDPACKQATNPVQRQAKMIPLDQMIVYLAKVEEKHQKDVKTIAQLEKEKVVLMNQVAALNDQVEDLEQMQTELHKDRDEIMDDYTQLRDAHNILQAKHKETEKKLKHYEETQMVREQESDKRVKKNKTPDQKLLKVFLAKAEGKHQRDVETIAQLEKEKVILINQVGTLNDHVEGLKEVLAKLYEDRSKIMDDYEVLQAEHRETEEKLKHCEELLMEYNGLKDTHNILQAEHKETEEKLKKLLMVQEQESHSILKEEKDIPKTLTTNQELLKFYSQEQEAHMHLQTEFEELKDKLEERETLWKELLEDSLDEARETISRLEEEKFMLIEHLGDVKDTLEAQDEALATLHMDHDKLMDKYNTLKDTHNVLQAEHNRTQDKLNHCKELPKLEKSNKNTKKNKSKKTQTTIQKLLKDYSRLEDTHNVLQAKHKETEEKLKRSEELLMVFLAKSKKEHQKDVKTITQLQKKKVILMNKVGTLNDHVEDLERMQAELHKGRDKIMDDYDILQAKHRETEEKLKRCEELLMVSLNEAEIKSQKDLETITQLQKERFNLIDQVGTMKDTVEDVEEMQAEIHKDQGDIVDVKEQESHSILKEEKDMSKTLTINQELLKEYEREQEGHRLLMYNYELMKENLENSEKLLDAKGKLRINT